MYIGCTYVREKKFLYTHRYLAHRYSPEYFRRRKRGVKEETNIRGSRARAYQRGRHEELDVKNENTVPVIAVLDYGFDIFEVDDIVKLPSVCVYICIYVYMHV